MAEPNSVASHQRDLVDARPLPWADLTDDQRTVVREINGVLGAMIEANRVVTPASAGAWAVPDPHRSNRVLFLDGARGSGKTSLMLTLLRGWNEEGALGADAREAFVASSGRVRALNPLDFDPLPPDLPLLAWFVHAFEALVERVDGAPTSSRPRAEVGLRERWQRTVQAGWEGWVPTSGVGRADTFLYEQERIGRWSGFRASWRDFLDALFQAAERAALLPAGALVVLPVDDLDLQVRRAAEVLDVLRLLHHPRLVVLANGDWEHLVNCRVVAFNGETNLLGRQWGIERIDARELGRALATKVIGRRWALESLTLKEAMAQRDGVLGERLNTYVIDGIGLGARLSDAPLTEPMLRMRLWQRLVDTVPPAESGMSSIEVLKRVLDAVAMSVVDDRGALPTRAGVELREGLLHATGWHNPVISASTPAEVRLQTGLCVGRTIRLRAGGSASQNTDSNWTDHEWHVLLGWLSLTTTAITVRSLQRVQHIQFLVWAEAGRNRLVVRWPWARKPTLVNYSEEAEAWWRTLAWRPEGRLEPRQVLHAWTEFQTGVVVGDRTERVFFQISVLHNRLQEGSVPEVQRNTLSLWLNAQLPLLAAPEFALDTETADELLDVCLDPRHAMPEDGSFSEVAFLDDRHAATQAKFARWEQARQRHHSDAEASGGPSRQAVLAAAQENPAHPWYQRQRPPGAWWGEIDPVAVRAICSAMTAFPAQFTDLWSWADPSRNGITSLSGPVAAWIGRATQETKRRRILIDALNGAFTGEHASLPSPESVVRVMWRALTRDRPGWEQAGEWIEPGPVLKDWAWRGRNITLELEFDAPMVVGRITAQRPKRWSGLQNVGSTDIFLNPLPPDLLALSGMFQTVLSDARLATPWFNLHPLPKVWLSCGELVLPTPRPTDMGWCDWLRLSTRWREAVAYAEARAEAVTPFELEQWLAVTWVRLVQNALRWIDSGTRFMMALPPLPGAQWTHVSNIHPPQYPAAYAFFRSAHPILVALGVPGVPDKLPV